MNPQTLDAYMNIFLLATVVGAILYGIYHFSRKKAPPPREAPKRPEGYRPRAKQEESDEQYYSHPPLTDWNDVPRRSPMRDAIVKPPSFRPQGAPKFTKAPKTDSAD